MTYSCARFAPGIETLEAAQQSKHDLICHKLGLPGRPGQTHPRCRLWLGCIRHSRCAALRRTSGRGDPQSGAGSVGARPDSSGRLGQRHRDPPAGLPRHTGRAVRRHRVGRHVRARGIRQERRILRHHAPPPPAGGSPAQSRDLERRRVTHRAAARSSGAMCSPTGSSSTSARSCCRWRRRASRCATSSPSASTTPRRSVPGSPTCSEHWDAAVADVGIRRARVWQLYMAASANGFEDGGISIHQVLGVVPGPEGHSGMPPTRGAWA